MLRHLKHDSKKSQHHRHEPRQSVDLKEIEKSLGILPVAFAILNKYASYQRSVGLSILSGLSQFALGGVNIIVLGYFLSSDDTHALLCTLGWHFFSAEAILSFNFANGWSTPLMIRHRRLTHICLQIFALVLIISGAILSFKKSGISTSAHGLTGFLAFLLTLFTVILGILSISGVQKIIVVHIIVALPTFFLSSICLCLCFVKPAFIKFSEGTMPYILMCWVLLYSGFIIGMAIANLQIRIKYFL